MIDGKEQNFVLCCEYSVKISPKSPVPSVERKTYVSLVKMQPNSESIESPSRWYQYVTVEPTMFLYMFAFQLTSVIEQEFFVRRSCMVNHNYNASICENLKNYPDIQKEVKVSCRDSAFPGCRI